MNPKVTCVEFVDAAHRRRPEPRGFDFMVRVERPKSPPSHAAPPCPRGARAGLTAA